MGKRIAAIVVLSSLFLFTGAIPALMLRWIPGREAVSPQETQYRRTVTALGVFRSVSEREIYLETPVIASRVAVSVGEWVEKGQLLAEIDTALTQAVLRDGLTVERQISQGIDLEALRGLYQQGALSQVYGGTESLLERLAGEGTVQPAYRTVETAVPNKIYAPISGVITELSLQENVLTQTSTPVLTVEDTSQLKVLLEVPEEQVSQVERGDAAYVTATATGVGCEGVVTNIYPTAQSSQYSQPAGTVVLVEVLIRECDPSIKPGFAASAVLMLEEPRTVLTLPYEAIGQDGDNQEFVYLWEEGRTRRREITVTEELARVAQVEGVGPEDRVLLSPDGLEEGQLVLLRKGGELWNS